MALNTITKNNPLKCSVSTTQVQMAPSPISPLTSLPPEVFTHICERLDDSGLINLRLTCQMAHDKTDFTFRNHFFRNLAIFFHPDSFAAFFEIASHPKFGQCVETVTVSTQRAYQVEFERGADEATSSAAWKHLTTIIDRGNDMTGSGEDILLLTKTFARLNNLLAVSVLDDFDYCVKIPPKSSKAHLTRCGSGALRANSDDAWAVQLSIRTECGSETFKPFESVIQALYASKKLDTELNIQLTGRNNLPEAEKTIDLTSPAWLDYGARNMHTLDMASTLPMEWNQEVFTSLKTLTKLYLDGMPRSREFQIKSSDFNPFLQRHASTITDITMKGCVIEENWVEFFCALRDMLVLTRLLLFRVSSKAEVNPHSHKNCPHYGLDRELSASAREPLQGNQIKVALDVLCRGINTGTSRQSDLVCLATASAVARGYGSWDSQTWTETDLGYCMRMQFNELVDTPLPYDEFQDTIVDEFGARVNLDDGEDEDYEYLSQDNSPDEDSTDEDSTDEELDEGLMG
ncbi:hypothetical protein B0J11DRAFT_617074 [Dendryphion nanum]|uniref:F-box domain-containing protein n=1 Tax=Dendryphion nanum TaxID=256645 RepID=A0A9P9DHH7_9PLEO|nr:hypothetical protein B0J11DRAFT_617074 [Dendryphion nanum]